MEGGNSSCSYLHILVLIFFFLASKLYATNITINQKVVVVGSLVNIFHSKRFSRWMTRTVFAQFYLVSVTRMLRARAIYVEPLVNTSANKQII